MKGKEGTPCAYSIRKLPQINMQNLCIISMAMLGNDNTTPSRTQQYDGDEQLHYITLAITRQMPLRNSNILRGNRVTFSLDTPSRYCS
jgi:hypothetical protein